MRIIERFQIDNRGELQPQERQNFIDRAFCAIVRDWRSCAQMNPILT